MARGGAGRVEVFPDETCIVGFLRRLFYSRSINHSSDFSSHETHIGNLGGSSNANLGVNFEVIFVAKKIVATFFGFVKESGIFSIASRPPSS